MRNRCDNLNASPFAMKAGWRWFGPSDAISLREIRQAGVTDVVTSLYEQPVGAVWPLRRLDGYYDGWWCFSCSDKRNAGSGKHPGDLPGPGIKTASPATPALQIASLPLSHWGSPNFALLLLLLSCFSRVRLCATL